MYCAQVQFDYNYIVHIHIHIRLMIHNVVMNTQRVYPREAIESCSRTDLPDHTITRGGSDPKIKNLVFISRFLDTV